MLLNSYNSPSPFEHFLEGSVRNLRTVIVTADIHRGLHSPACILANAHHPCLTFRHWSGVTPYTSSCEFAGSCVFVKQLPGKLSLRPHVFRRGQALSRSYGRFFAEFLKGLSLVRLGLLDLTTCVGLRYGTTVHCPLRGPRSFSWKRAHLYRFTRRIPFLLHSD